MVDGAILNVNNRGSIPLLLTAFHPATKLSGVLALRLDMSPSSYRGGLPGALDNCLADLIKAGACLAFS